MNKIWIGLIILIVLFSAYYWFIWRNVHVGLVSNIKKKGAFISMDIDGKSYTFDWYEGAGVWQRKIEKGYIEISSMPNSITVYRRNGKQVQKMPF